MDTLTIIDYKVLKLLRKKGKVKASKITRRFHLESDITSRMDRLLNPYRETNEKPGEYARKRPGYVRHDSETDTYEITNHGEYVLVDYEVARKTRRSSAFITGLWMPLAVSIAGTLLSNVLIGLLIQLLQTK